MAKKIPFEKRYSRKFVLEVVKYYIELPVGKGKKSVSEYFQLKKYQVTEIIEHAFTDGIISDYLANMVIDKSVENALNGAYERNGIKKDAINAKWKTKNHYTTLLKEQREYRLCPNIVEQVLQMYCSDIDKETICEKFVLGNSFFKTVILNSIKDGIAKKEQIAKILIILMRNVETNEERERIINKIISQIPIQ